jgi:hypothetical protein
MTYSLAKFYPNLPEKETVACGRKVKWVVGISTCLASQIRISEKIPSLLSKGRGSG